MLLKVNQTRHRVSTNDLFSANASRPDRWSLSSRHDLESSASIPASCNSSQLSSVPADHGHLTFCLFQESYVRDSNQMPTFTAANPGALMILHTWHEHNTENAAPLLFGHSPFVAPVLLSGLSATDEPLVALMCRFAHHPGLSRRRCGGHTDRPRVGGSGLAARGGRA